jgi:hypothetical protein
VVVKLGTWQTKRQKPQRARRVAEDAETSLWSLRLSAGSAVVFLFFTRDCGAQDAGEIEQCGAVGTLV